MIVLNVKTIYNVLDPSTYVILIKIVMIILTKPIYFISRKRVR
jgi:hypothetical protein